MIDVSNFTSLEEVFALLESNLNNPVLCYADWSSQISKSIDSQNTFLFMTYWTCIALTFKGDIYRANKDDMNFIKINQNITMTLDGTTLNIQTW